MSAKSSSKIKDLAAALISSSFDKDQNVKDIISHSLSNFGKQQPEVVLNTVHDFIVDHSKIDQSHKVLLLRVVNDTLQGTDLDISIETATKLINLASENLTKSKKMVPDLQSAASDILVTLGMTFVTEVMEELRKKFVPGILPHFYVVQTLGKLATSNVPGMINHISGILSTTLPLLGLAKNEKMRIVFATSMANFCECILEYLSNQTQLPSIDATPVNPRGLSTDTTSDDSEPQVEELQVEQGQGENVDQQSEILDQQSENTDQQSGEVDQQRENVDQQSENVEQHQNNEEVSVLERNLGEINEGVSSVDSGDNNAAEIGGVGSHIKVDEEDQQTPVEQHHPDNESGDTAMIQQNEQNLEIETGVAGEITPDGDPRRNRIDGETPADPVYVPREVPVEQQPVGDVINKSTFTNEIFGAYCVFYNQWFASRDYKVVNAVIPALGKMFLLLHKEKVEDQAPKLVTSLIAQYRRNHCDPLSVSKSLCDIITAVTNHKSTILENILDYAITAFYNQIFSTPENASQTVTKNYNEVLRCFGLLATCYCEILIGMILQRAESRDEKVRAGNLVVLRHLINSNPLAMERNKEMVVVGFLKHLNEASNYVKQQMAKLIISMATHNYLQSEGGQEYVHFIVRQCSLPDCPSSRTEKGVSAEQLRTMCDDILYLITSTVDNMDKILWPYLFGFLMDESLTNSFGVVCHSLAYIAEKKCRENADDYIINYDLFVNVPRPVALVSRLMVMLGHPLEQRCHSDSVLTLLQHLSGGFNPVIVALWNEEVPKIVQFLQENNQDNVTWPQKPWEDLLIAFLSKTLNVLDDEKWTCEFGEIVIAQWPLYTLYNKYKNFSYKCLGIVLRRSRNTEFVKSRIPSIFLSTFHSNPAEREGVAVCLGYCASTHLSTTMAKFQEFVQLNITKKESSYFNRFKREKTLIDIENMKGTVALCCGYISFFSSPELITSWIETTIVKILSAFFKGIKDSAIKVDIVNAVKLIADSLDPSHTKLSKNKAQYIFAAREDLMAKLLVYMKDDGMLFFTSLKAAIWSACAALIKLEPPISDNELGVVIKQSVNHFVAVNHVSPVNQTSNNNTVDKENFELLKQNAAYLQHTCTSSFYGLLEEVLINKINTGGLYMIFRNLEPFLTSEKAHERLNALKSLKSGLAVYLRLLIICEINKTFQHLGLYLARLLPLCCDVLVEIRLEALCCITSLLEIQDKYNGIKRNVEDNDLGVREKLSSADSQVMYEALTHLAQSICLKIPSDLTQFYSGSMTTSLFDALTWQQSMSANGACLVLNHIFDTRGAMFSKKVLEIVTLLVEKLSHFSNNTSDKNYTKEGILQLFNILARHHSQSTVNALLTFPLPFSNVMLLCWSSLGSGQMRDVVIDFLLDHLDRSLPYEEVLRRKGKADQTSHKTAALTSLSVCCALNEVLSATPNNLAHQRNNNVYRIITMAIVRMGTMLDVKPYLKLEIDPYSQSVKMLRMVLMMFCGRKISFHLEEIGMWRSLEERDGVETFTAALAAIVSSFCKHRPEDIPSIISSLNRYLPSIYEMQRITVVAFFAQLVKEPTGRDDVLLEILMNSLRSRLVDQDNHVRQICIRGLSNIIYAPNEQMERYSTSVLSAMMAGMDDKNDLDDSITLEAMSGLAKFLYKVERTNIHSIFINICLRVRPCFEKDNPFVRGAAFELFGALGRFGIDQSEASYKEQTHSNFISILLHLNDVDSSVKKSCKIALREIGPRLGSDNVNETFQKLLIDSTHLHYGEFMNNLAKILVAEFPDKINFYIMGCVSFFKSQWPTLRCNAAMFLGFLMANLDTELQSSINKDHSCAALIQLLKDQSPEVRSKAAEAISLLHHF